MKIRDLGSPKKLGYYQVQSFLTCKFTLFANSIETEQKLKNPGRNINALLGIIFHSLIEKLSSESDPMVRLLLGKQYIDEQSDKLRNEAEFWWLEPLFSYAQTNSILTKVANYSTNDLSKKMYNGTFEYELCTKDELFFGRADKVLVSEKETIIHEYKSTDGLDRSSFIAKHSGQIEFYAGIVLENDPLAKVEGLIFSSDLSPIKIEISTNKVLSHLKSLRELITKTIIESSSYEDLQTPTPNNCIGCKLKPICRSFLNSVEQFNDFDGAVISGKLVGKTQNNSPFYILDLEIGDHKRQVSISKYHPFYKSAEVGKFYTLSDLRSLKGKLDFSQRTVVYEE